MPDAVGHLERGREAFAEGSWGPAYEALSTADREHSVTAEDLERLATSAYMLGFSDRYFELLERAYEEHLGNDAPLAALRCAFWIGVNLAQRGEMGRAGGWLGRAQRLLEKRGAEGPETGYLLLPQVFAQEGSGELEAAAKTAAEAATIGERFADDDLAALAGHERGHILIRVGRIPEGLALLDEAMLTATAGRLSPMVCGIVYCGVILACRDAHELGRSREWTAVLSDWCERQPDLVAFTGRCLVHRAEILQLDGSWPRALKEAERAKDRCLHGENPAAAGDACYRKGEIHRLRGEFAAAEQAYGEASGFGFEPQPGFALLRLAQGDTEAATAAIRRVEGELSEPGPRAGVLPAYVEIMVAADELRAARTACAELESLASDFGSAFLEAVAAETRGRLELALGEPGVALRSLRAAAEAWRELHTDYELARARELAGVACRELGDEDSAKLELDAGAAAFARLGARPDLVRVGMLAEIASAVEAHGLTQRELEVLRHLASGATNKAIAAELVLSVRTIDRHVSNVYAKLGVSSRAAATAYAIEHGLA